MNIPEKNEYEILDRITDGFIALDTSWNLIYINKAALELLLINEKEVIGKFLSEKFPKTRLLPIYDNFHKAMTEQVPVNFEMFFPPLKLWFHVRAFPSSDGLSVYFQDITENKRVSSQSEQHYKSLFENNPSAVFSFDLNGNYLSVNPAMEQLLGYSKDEFLQMSYVPIIVESEKEKVNVLFSKAARGMTQNYETKMIHKSGYKIDIRVTNMPIIVNEEIVGVYGIAKDITKEKRTEKLLSKSEKLTAVGQLAASIAHEIRNPLTSIKGFLQLIKKDIHNFNHDYLDIMSDEITRIEMITGELLVLAKPQAGLCQYENVDKMIKDVVMLLSSQALMNNVDVQVDINNLPMIKCNGSQLKQVFINLMKNSIEAMPNGGELEITARLHSSTHILIQVKDQGYGIPEEFLAEIGSPFYTTKEKGTGLGMMTTLKIIDSHNGTVDISSKLNEGTTVDIYLPFNIEHKEETSNNE